MGERSTTDLPDPDDPNEFVLLIEVDDLEKGRQAFQSDELQARIQRSGQAGRRREWTVFYPEA